MIRQVPTYQTVIMNVAMGLFIIAWLLPFYFFITRAFGTEGLDNFKAVLGLPLFPRFYLNSAIIGVSVVAIKGVAVVFAAYAFSRMRFPGKEILFLITLTALMIPPAALLVPLFQLMLKLNWLNTYMSVIGPEVAMGLPLMVLLVRVAIDEIPKDLFEAAEIDGCGHLGKLRYVALPIIVPALATVTVLTFLHAWNQYLFPLVFMQDAEMYTVTLSLNYFKGEYGVDIGKIFAAMVLVCLPVIVVYLIAQKFLQKGLVSGAVK
ncbi:carbohydrate ABC transporter permease [Paenibacillus sp.]|uniref:carbohydrate ABC transporter permease n=1 Tax=Paenibacillus sp. TaxID=58172 RepID=UPI002D3E6612|nr:carbohydrate ABC transporter permease [Paenibacillus sp.]HZG84025.1 carbohydrate ABC transporter permease [Paenibacillus sp.]